MCDHQGRKYLITGGTSGIGAYVAKALTSAGATVTVTGRDEGRVAEAIRAGLAEFSLGCDVSDTRAAKQGVYAAGEQMDGLDAVFANAGGDGQALPAQELDLDCFADVLATNVIGILATCQAAFQVLNRPGAIVVNSSVNALRPEKNFADYNASKAASLSIAQSLALDWADERITVNAVCPGYFRSRMTESYLDDPKTAGELLARIPQGRFGSADEIASLVGFLMLGSVPFLAGAGIPIAGASHL
jgi:NAD(P)-dependent dehydrogenase (short-subunit alcohol dehydrogenase family)